VEVRPSEAGVKILLLGDDNTTIRSFEVPKSYPGYLDLNETLDYLTNNA
jgi:hypothetical protein